LAGEDHEDHHQRQDESEVERRAALLQLAGLAGERGAAAPRQDLARDPVERVERLAQGEAGGQAGRERRGPHPVEVVELARRRAPTPPWPSPAASRLTSAASRPRT